MLRVLALALLLLPAAPLRAAEITVFAAASLGEALDEAANGRAFSGRTFKVHGALCDWDYRGLGS